MHNIETLHNKIWLLQKALVSYSKHTSLNQYRSSNALAGMDNIDTFHHKKIVAAETVGFIFEGDLFKSPSMFLGPGCHEQH